MLSELLRWLSDPRVELVLTPSDEVQRLRAEVDMLHSQIDGLLLELKRTRTLYGQECNRNMLLEDVLRSHNIHWR